MLIIHTLFMMLHTYEFIILIKKHHVINIFVNIFLKRLKTVFLQQKKNNNQTGEFIKQKSF